VQSSSASDQRPSKPIQLTILVGLVLLEALALLIIAGMYAVELAAGQAHVSPGGAIFTMVLLVVLGAGVGVAGILLWRGYRWTRSVVLVVQLFAATIGLPTMSGGYVFYGLLILVPAAAALYLLFSRPVFAITQRPVHENPPD
jgi:hypothetical protein